MKNTLNPITSSLLTLTVIALTPFAQAQEVARVLSATPIVQQVATPRQVCTNEQVAVNGPKSGAGAAMGAIAGGAIGNSVGRGDGKAAATMLGLFGGAILGDKIEGNPTPEVRNVQNCTRQMVYESRVTAYSVVYEFAGKQYTAQMPNDPGPSVRLQITPIAGPSYAPVQTGYPQPNYGNVPGNGMVPPPGSAPQQ
jgi:uncharacterized protein YcfJ